MNMETKQSVITKTELILVSKKYEYGRGILRYTYNFYLEDMENPVLIEDLESPLNDQFVGSNVTYDIDKKGRISRFIIE